MGAMASKLALIAAAALAGALVRAGSDLAGLSTLVTVLVAAVVLALVVGIGTPIAFGVDPVGLVRGARRRSTTG